MAKKSVNLEIQDYVIRFAEMKKNKKGYLVTNCDEHYFPTGIIENGEIENEQLFIKTLKYCIRKWKLKGKKLRFILPDSSVVIRTVDIPAQVEDDEITGHVYFELGQSIHLPFENPVLDTELISESEEFKKAVVVASSFETVETYADHFKSEKLSPTVADVSALCQYRLFHKLNQTSEQDIYMLAQFNVKSVTISIFENHHPVFMQQITIPYPDETWKIVPLHQGGYLTKEQFDKEKVHSAFLEIFTEMERIFRFYQFSLKNGEQEVSKILLTGDHPYLLELSNESKGRFKVPIESLVLENIQVAKGIKKGYQYNNVIGLAMKEGV